MVIRKANMPVDIQEVPLSLTTVCVLVHAVLSLSFTSTLLQRLHKSPHAASNLLKIPGIAAHYPTTPIIIITLCSFAIVRKIVLKMVRGLWCLVMPVRSSDCHSVTLNVKHLCDFINKWQVNVLVWKWGLKQISIDVEHWDIALEIHVWKCSYVSELIH